MTCFGNFDDFWSNLRSMVAPWGSTGCQRVPRLPKDRCWSPCGLLLRGLGEPFGGNFGTKCGSRMNYVDFLVFFVRPWKKERERDCLGGGAYAICPRLRMFSEGGPRHFDSVLSSLWSRFGGPVRHYTPFGSPWWPKQARGRDAKERNKKKDPPKVPQRTPTYPNVLQRPPPPPTPAEPPRRTP